MIEEKLDSLIEEIKGTSEYKEYETMKQSIAERKDILILLQQLSQLRILYEADKLRGDTASETEKQISSLMNLLTDDDEAMDYLISEYKFHKVISDVLNKLNSLCDDNFTGMI